MSEVKVGLYVRSSVPDCTAMQLSILREVAKARGCQTMEYIDDARSSCTDHRPVLEALLRAAREKKVVAVLCGSLDRLHRSCQDLMTLLDEPSRLGIEVIVANR